MAHSLPDYHPQTELRIEPPTGRSTSFRIRYKSPDTQNKWTALHSPDIEAANRLLKTGVSSREHTHEKLKIVLAAQYAHRDRRKTTVPFWSSNLALVEVMWTEKYNRRKRRNMKRPEDSKYQLIKAVEACGMYPLDTCNLDDLADYLDATLGDDQNRLSRRITWINSILQWLGRSKLQAVSRTRPKVTYLNESEFAYMCTFIKDEVVVRLARIAFYTGARLGEIFYIQTRHIKKFILSLELQMTDIRLPDGSFKEDTLKNGHAREIFMHDQILEELKWWAGIPFSERYKIRLKGLCKIIKQACRKAFGDSDPIKLLTFHALRHCCAIWLLQAGATIVEVAQQLGNSPDVCYRYYSGFELKKESVERLRMLVSKGPDDDTIAQRDHTRTMSF